MSAMQILRTALLAGALTATAATALAQSQAPAQKEPDPTQKQPEQFEGTMTLELMGEIVSRLDEKAQQPRPGYWQFTVEKRPVVIITDLKADRMRIMVPVARIDQLSRDDLMRIAQANFDSALDSRYAIAQKILWSVYIHPLRELHKRQFITAIGQTVNLAVTYGTTYSSGALTFGGGDSNSILRKKLIDDLLKKGQDI
ncbi:MAG: type III secretion system chaperone [Hyphomicrobiales bacterium]|nr:type III secretion system chaperone [Hyphomicrobiales bacterium]